MTRRTQGFAKALAFLALFGSALHANVVLRIPDYPLDSHSDPQSEADREAIRLFEERYPTVKIERFMGIQSIGSLSEAPELMALAGGTAPDVLDVFVHKVQNYIDQGFAQPIEDKLPGWEGKRNMPDVFWPSVTRGKHVYGVVREWYSLQLMYRKDMFKEAGLDPDKPPKTWDELYDYAQKLTFPDKIVANMTTDKKGQYGFQLNGGWTAAWQFPIWVWQAGGDVVEAYTQDAKGGVAKRYSLEQLYKERLTLDMSKIKWRVTFDSPEAIKALEFWKKLIFGKWQRDGKEYEGVVTTTVFGSADLDEFGRGKVAMKIYSPTWWALDTYGLAPSQVGMAPLPAGPGGRANYAAGNLYMINSKVTNPELRDAAWNYIAFKTSDEYRRILVKHLIQGDAPYQLKPDELIRFGYTSFYEKFPRNWVDTAKFTKDNLYVETYAPNYQVIQTNELVVPLAKVMTDKNADPYAEMHTMNERVNSFIYGLRPPAQQASLRRTALVIFIVVLLILGVVFYFTLREKPGDLNPVLAGGTGMWSARSWSTHAKVWSMLGMAVFSILIWNYVPLVEGGIIAFQDYRIMGGSHWVFLDNFIDLFSQPQFLQIIGATLYYVVLSLSLGFAAPILLALMLAEVPKGQVLFRVVYYLPAVMAPLVVSMMWVVLFSESSDGALNSMFSVIGIGPQKWLGDPSQAMICIVATGIWSGVGAGSLIYLAALKTIPEEVYDAADLDGCSTLQKVRYITIPYLMPLILINFLGAFIGAFHAAENIFVMTQGGPGVATKTAGVDIFLNAYMFLKYGMAIAEAWLLGALLIGFTLYQLRIFQKSEFKTAGATGA